MSILFSYVPWILSAVCITCAVVWWGLRIGGAWDGPGRRRAVLLLLIPVATLIISRVVAVATFRFALLFGVIAALAHMAIAIWEKPHRVYASILASLFVLAVADSTFVFLIPEDEHAATEVNADVAADASDAAATAPDEIIPDVLKQDCQHLVEGQLVFTPETTMRQGKDYSVSARLSRGNDANITSGLDKGTVVVENAKVSCMVSMALDSEEADAFKVENVPAGRAAEQILRPSTFAQWDWHVTPLKSGVLHLLLYVTPMLYVDGVGRGLQQFPQTPRVITVSPDYSYIIWNSIRTNWAIWGTILTVIVVPLLLWLVGNLKARLDRQSARKPAGFGEAVASDSDAGGR
jgi:hypothetical protein